MGETALNLLSIARKGGYAALGEDAVGAECRAQHAQLVVVASDASDHTFRKAQNLARAAACPAMRIQATKQELGYSVGRSTCALACVTDAGLALSLGTALGSLSEADLEALRAFDARQRKLRKESKAHRSNLRHKKK